MKTLLSLSLFFLLTGCDAPQRTRAPSTYLNGNNFTNANSGFTTGTTTAPSSGTTTGTTTPPASSLGPGFETCNIGDTFQTIDIGWFGLCQSTQDETVFKFRTSLSSQTVRVCLIPTYKDSSGSSTYIGNPQCTYTTAGQVVTGKLYKDRSGFSTYPLNGVMVMKESLLPEYFNCMQAFVGWPANLCSGGTNQQYCSYWGSMCPYGGPTNATCDTEAKNYMSVTCNSFKSKYTNSYLDIKLK